MIWIFTELERLRGGVRARISSCFTTNEDSYDEYRPIFWYTDKDKKEYIDFFEIKLSDCYKVYGLPRTGCSGCPFAGKNLKNELEILEKYEPKLLKATNNIFKDSYEYTEKYREYLKKKNETISNYRDYLKNKN